MCTSQRGAVMARDLTLARENPSCEGHAHRMLSRELSDLLMARDGVDFAADAVGDDVFHWQLTFERFTPACPLAAVRLSSALLCSPRRQCSDVLTKCIGQDAVFVLVDVK